MTAGGCVAMNVVSGFGSWFLFNTLCPRRPERNGAFPSCIGVPVSALGVGSVMALMLVNFFERLSPPPAQRFKHKCVFKFSGLHQQTILCVFVFCMPAGRGSITICWMLVCP